MVGTIPHEGHGWGGVEMTLLNHRLVGGKGVAQTKLSCKRFLDI